MSTQLDARLDDFFDGFLSGISSTLLSFRIMSDDRAGHAAEQMTRAMRRDPAAMARIVDLLETGREESEPLVVHRDGWERPA